LGASTFEQVVDRQPDGGRRVWRRPMLIELNEEQCSELQGLLENSLGDMSSEIAGTDNPEYREGLRERRRILESVLYQLDNPPREPA
jgi:hypothetical protein